MVLLWESGWGQFPERDEDKVARMHQLLRRWLSATCAAHQHVCCKFVLGF